MVAALVLAALVSCGPSAPPAQPTPPVAGEATLEVVMHGFRSDRGAALVGLYVGPSGFPSQGEAAYRRLETLIVDGVATATFDGVPAARVAVGVLHDEDGDKKMKTGFFGVPKEGFGVSRDAPARFGPPSFDDAALDVADGEHARIEINVRY